MSSSQGGRVMVSERQQMKLLQQQQQQQEAAEAEEHADHGALPPSPTKKKAQGKPKVTLEQRKLMAREAAQGKKKLEDEKEEQPNNDDYEDDSSEAEFGEEPTKKRKSRGSEDGGFAPNEKNIMEEEESDKGPVETRTLRRLIGIIRQKPLSDSEGEKTKEKKESKPTIPKKKGSIPRHKEGGIPRRAKQVVGDGATATGASGETKSEETQSSLIQNIKRGTTPVIPVSTALRQQPMIVQLPAASKPRGSAWDNISHRSGSGGRQGPTTAITQAVSWTPGLTPSRDRDMLIMPPPQLSQPTQHSQTKQIAASPRESEKDRRVLHALDELCQSLTADSRFQIPTGPSVDMSGSFLSDDRYDFFDTDKDGEIVVQAMIPIFPEDFAPGVPQWPLSWWGIVDPALPEAQLPKAEIPQASLQELRLADGDVPRQMEQRDRPPPPSGLNQPPPFRPDAGSRGGRGGGGGRGQGPPHLGGPPPSHVFHGPPHPFPHSRGGGPRSRVMHPGDWRGPPAGDWRPPPDRR